MRASTSVESAVLLRWASQELKDVLKSQRIASVVGPRQCGKTTLVKGAGDELGVKDPVISPTFNILKCYFKGKLPMYHIDGYRLEGQNLDIGLEEAIYGDGITFIEWPEYVAAILPDEYLELSFEKTSDEGRKITFTARGKRAEEMLGGLSL